MRHIGFILLMGMAVLVSGTVAVADVITFNNNSITNSAAPKLIVQEDKNDSSAETKDSGLEVDSGEEAELTAKQQEAKVVAAPGVYKIINPKGPRAPALTLTKTIQKSPVKSNTKTIQVVEFWATWCGPCRTTIPHLSKVQESYAKQNVSIIGVSREEESKVAPFVKQMGKKMTYGVGVDTSGKTSAAYSKIWKVNSIPHAYVVSHEGRILWHGNPGNVRKFETAIREAIQYRDSGK